MESHLVNPLRLSFLYTLLGFIFQDAKHGHYDGPYYGGYGYAYGANRYNTPLNIDVLVFSKAH